MTAFKTKKKKISSVIQAVKTKFVQFYSANKFTSHNSLISQWYDVQKKKFDFVQLHVSLIMYQFKNWELRLTFGSHWHISKDISEVHSFRVWQ